MGGCSRCRSRRAELRKVRRVRRMRRVRVRKVLSNSRIEKVEWVEWVKRDNRRDQRPIDHVRILMKRPNRLTFRTTAAPQVRSGTMGSIAITRLHGGGIRVTMIITTTRTTTSTSMVGISIVIDANLGGRFNFHVLI
jgi:hypothetical protein